MAIVEIKIKDIKPGENYRKHQDKGGMKELTASVVAKNYDRTEP